MRLSLFCTTFFIGLFVGFGQSARAESNQWFIKADIYSRSNFTIGPVVSRGTISGTFSYDTESNSVTNVNVNVSGTGLAGTYRFGKSTFAGNPDINEDKFLRLFKNNPADGESVGDQYINLSVNDIDDGSFTTILIFDQASANFVGGSFPINYAPNGMNTPESSRNHIARVTGGTCTQTSGGICFRGRFDGDFGFEASAGTIRPTAKSPLAVVYVNGINTEADDAFSEAYNLGLINDAVRREEVDYFYFYNATGGFIEDIIESTVQKLRLEGETRLSTVDLVRAFWSTLTSPLSDRAVALLTETFVDTVGNSPSVAQTQGFTDQLTSLLDSYESVVLVGYSQGNLFVNEAFSELPTSNIDDLSVVGIATPASFVAGLPGNGDYTTEKFDKILLVPNSLKLNLTENFPPCNPVVSGFGTCLLNHSLLDIYLSDGSNTEKDIVRMLNSAISEN
ncbi:MAG: hypothetical protein AAGA09_03215 [Pseudomonadota bacterium]